MVNQGGNNSTDASKQGEVTENLRAEAEVEDTGEQPRHSEKNETERDHVSPRPFQGVHHDVQLWLQQKHDG